MTGARGRPPEDAEPKDEAPCAEDLTQILDKNRHALDLLRTRIQRLKEDLERHRGRLDSPRGEDQEDSEDLREVLQQLERLRQQQSPGSDPPSSVLNGA